jgi:NAD(P)-dependent dehydrogenase (short-subunit alcohol dehydrogenase family)
MCQAVWPHMKAQGYGRIVSASSGAFTGNRYTSIYGLAKGGIFSLIRALAIEGADHGIRANCIGPAALTIALQHLSQPSMSEHAAPAELVAPVVAYLCHEECPVSGTYLESGGGQTSAKRVATTGGYSDPDLTLEKVRDNFDQIVDPANHSLDPEPLDNPYANIIDPKPYRPA